jgi:hypothetical protein
VQHAEEADFRAEVSRIAGDFEKCFRTGAEQQAIDDFGENAGARIDRITSWERGDAAEEN